MDKKAALIGIEIKWIKRLTNNIEKNGELIAS